VFETRKQNVQRVIGFAKELRHTLPKKMSVAEGVRYEEAIIRRTMTELFVSRRTAYEYAHTALAILRASK
jgi:hypothetical protein